MKINRKIFTNGCFDLIHRGHLELLDYCRSLGYVIVGLNSDESVTRIKGKGRPVNNQEDRKKLLLSLKSVDEVIIFQEDTPYNLIKSLKPDLIVKGGDYSHEEVIGNELCDVKIFKTIPGYSTTSLISTLNHVNNEILY
jgi:D-beta-D-heptose 7-phosphate kinase/D-beta-D-heptose 1-phosphate adenosyltransferase